MRARRTAGILCACLAAALWAAPAAGAAQFGLSELEVASTDSAGAISMQAGSHPFALSLKSAVVTEGGVPVEQAKDVQVALPPGLVGDQAAAPPCSAAQFLAGETSGGECPDATAIGTVEVEYGLSPGETELETAPLYNLVPSPGTLVKAGFLIEGGAVPVVAEVILNPNPPYNLLARATNISQAAFYLRSKITVWGVPADPLHDPYRGHCLAPSGGSLGHCHVSEPEVPLLRLPTSCAGPLATTVSADSWQHPAVPYPFSATVLSHGESGEPIGPTGCSALPFAPTISAQPTSRAAQSPSGLDFSFEVPQEGFTDPGGIASSDIEKLLVTLPPGMSANPSVAEGLVACSEPQLAAETASSPPGAGCPQASKVGTIEVQTPALPGRTLHGSMFVATPYENLAQNSLIALYVVVEDAELGIVVKQAVRVEPDPATGQLKAIAEGLPQVPLGRVALHFREGGRAPLITPPRCGTYDGRNGDPEPVKAELTPWSGGSPLTTTSAFQIVSGPDNGPCPPPIAPFSPGFEAGTLSNAAGSYSPFDMRLTRKDGEQDMGKFSFVLPPGVVPKLAGIPYCPEAAIALARSRTGPHGAREELQHPACPAASKIGRTLAGAGAGSQLTYVPGSLYLAGPYHGDPISAVAITPALAGPFDAGTVVVREALRLNPVTHVGEVDGAASEPIPHILKGIPLNLRELRVYADRPEFTLNATSCEPFAAQATIWGDGTALVPTGETPAGVSSRYQAADCQALGFKPKLGLKLRGGTRRGSFPALRAVYTPRPGDANLSRLALRFPTSEFIEQGHFRTICTRVQFAAAAGNGEACPAASVYGHVRAWSPLLAAPLEGPVFLRSSSHNLPDAVFALHGLVDIDVVVRIDSKNGGLRATLEGAPDAPVSRAIVDMQGGKKGLFVNSTNLCGAKHRAQARATGQNGRVDNTKPLVRARCAEARKKAKHKVHHKPRSSR